MVRHGHFFGASLPKEKAKKGPCFSYRSVSLCHPLHASKGEFAGFGKYAGCTYDSVELPAALAFEVHPTENDTWLPKEAKKKSRKRVSRYATKAAPQKPPTSEVERMLAFCASKVGRGEDVEEVHSVHVTRDDAVIWGAGPRQSPTLAQLVSGLVGAPRRKLLKLHNAISASHAPDEERSPFYSEKSSLSFKFLSAALQFLRAVVRKDIGDIADLLAPNCEMDQFGEFYEGKRECLAWYKAHLQIHSKQLREEVEEEVEPLAYRFPAICCVDVAHRCVDYRFECLVPGQEAVGVQVLHMNRELRVVKIQTVYHKLPATRAMGDDGDAETPLEAEEEEHPPSDDSPPPEIHFSALAALRSSSARSVITADLPPPPPPKVWVKAAPPVVIYFEDCDACQPLLDAAMELNCDLYRISADGLVDDDEIAALSARLSLERNTTVYCNGPLEKIAKCLTAQQRKFTAIGAYAPLPGESLEDVDSSSNILSLLRDSCYPGFVSLHLSGAQLEAWSTELCADAVFPEEGPTIEITPEAEAKVREEIAAWWDREVETEWASLYIDADVGEDGVTNTPAMRMKVHATNKGTTTVVPEVVRSGASLYEQLLPLLKDRSGNETVSLRQSFSESSVSKMNVDVAYEREKNLFTVCQTYGENAQPRKFKQQLEEFLNTQVAPLLPLDLSVMAGESAGDADFAPAPLIFHGEFAVLAEGSRPVGWGSDVILNEWHAFRWGPGVAGKCAESGENLFAKVLGAAGAGKTEEDIGAEIAALEAELGIAEDNADA